MADRTFKLKEVEPEIVPPQSIEETNERLMNLERMAINRPRSGSELYRKIEVMEARLGDFEARLNRIENGEGE